MNKKELKKSEVAQRIANVIHYHEGMGYVPIDVFYGELDQALDETRKETIEEIKKKLPTHKGKILSRTEVKKFLDSLKLK